MADRFADIVPTDAERAAYPPASDFIAFDHNGRVSVGYMEGAMFRTLGYSTNFTPGTKRTATADEYEAALRYYVGMDREMLARDNANNAKLSYLGLTVGDFYRFRGVWDEDGKLAVNTRGGGGNRECFCEDWSKPEERTDLTCGDPHHPHCVRPMQRKLRQHPLYLFDEDDDDDCTYATFYFRAEAKS